MENILSLNLKKVFNIVSALFLSAAVIFGSEAKADTENGYFEEKAKYGSWRTGYLYLNNETFARMATFNHETLSAFAVDLKGNYYFASLIVAKTPKYKGRINNTNTTKIPCQLRIDSREIFYNSCYLEETTDSFYIVIPEGLDLRFLEEARKGYTLRIKLETYDPIYFSFSLKGFTKGYAKISQLNSARW